jgi:hypothetical protein
MIKSIMWIQWRSVFPWLTILLILWFNCTWQKIACLLNSFLLLFLTSWRSIILNHTIWIIQRFFTDQFGESEKSDLVKANIPPSLWANLYYLETCTTLKCGLSSDVLLLNWASNSGSQQQPLDSNKSLLVYGHSTVLCIIFNQ